MAISNHKFKNSNDKNYYKHSTYEVNTNKINPYFSNSGDSLEKTSTENIKDEIIKNILLTKIELDVLRQNYEFAESDLIDYYLYQIKANQAKLDFLIKSAKSCKLCLNTVEKMNYDAII